MAWVAVEKGGKEEIFVNKPYRKRGNSNILRFCNPIYWTDEDVCKYGNKDTKIELSKGSIKKLIGRDLDWSDEPVELKEE